MMKNGDVAVFGVKGKDMFKGLFSGVVVASLMVGMSSGAFASSSQCPQFFANGQAPDIIKSSMQKDTISLCHTGYSNLYSGLVLDPLYSADVLTTESVNQGRGSGRHGNFHVEPMLPYNMQVTPNDFKNTASSYFDRGHMVPNGDMPNAELQEETFSMSNMIPQDADNNEGLHEGIEVATRNLAARVGQIYVVTGPVFNGKELERLNGKSFIPTMIFKAIYIPGVGASAYLEDNQPGVEYSVISINDLKELTGIDVFPGISDADKSKVLNLPVPTPTFKGGTRESRALGMKFGKPELVSVEQLVNDIGKVSSGGNTTGGETNMQVTTSRNHPVLRALHYFLSERMK